MDELRQAVDPGAKPFGVRMREAVPGLVRGRITETVGAGEVDDNAALRWLDRRSRLMREANDRDIGAVRERSVVRDEGGKIATAEARVERGSRAPGERVGPDRDEL